MTHAGMEKESTGHKRVQLLLGHGQGRVGNEKGLMAKGIRPQWQYHWSKRVRAESARANIPSPFPPEGGCEERPTHHADDDLDDGQD